MNFTTDWEHIVHRIDKVDVLQYAQNRNFIDGSVSYLSPYISRGAISTRLVRDRLLKRYPAHRMEKILQELAWRDYWQLTWKVLGDGINTDIKRPQEQVDNWGVPKQLVEAATGIEGVDQQIKQLVEKGYMHNHARMYVASMACNLGRSHWKAPAKWMYYHLLDGDWASNALSWQWVAGTNAGKKYFAEQGNINRFCHTNQQHTFLDVDKGELEQMNKPSILTDVFQPDLRTLLPTTERLEINTSIPTCVYTSYNLDPHWRKEQSCNRILLLELSHFEKYPVSPLVLNFILKLANEIPGMQVVVGEFNTIFPGKDVFFKEHPLNSHFLGTEDQRDWMADYQFEYIPSFFKFWKKYSKAILQGE